MVSISTHSEKYLSNGIISPIFRMNIPTKKKELPTHPVITICPQTTLGTSIISTSPIFPKATKRDPACRSKCQLCPPRWPPKAWHGYPSLRGNLHHGLSGKGSKLPGLPGGTTGNEAYPTVEPAIVGRGIWETASRRDIFVKS